jgi:hypothetical protein
MGRINKTIEGVFTDLVGAPNEISSYDMFLKGTENESHSPVLKSFIDSYKKIVDKNKPEFIKLAKLEEIIMQMRIKENLNDIKLTIVRGYIYARCPFYRQNKSAKEIRVIVDNAEFWKGDVDQLMNSKEFMTKARTKLAAAMQKEIDQNLGNLSDNKKKKK